MDDIFALNRRLARSWWDMTEVGWAATVTIAARLPMIAAAATGFGSQRAQRETREMVSEKLMAAAEGAQAGALQTARATFKVMTGDSHPTAMAHHLIDVAEAATRPAGRKARANAKRLWTRGG
ncbi:hypothetical protein CCR94_20845 [Rhodoblastus sphagnicola]|uniref:Uncharacterized protein n=1 Tax=Rhodoblastus sphagnicola TaxID=333368 RepID=A0A2S6MXN6_9HYPH|nr:hypothetical protein [Rhodoblastus sphagnicola]MBB4196774.1 hypothetical protein [Rhodoblastus sphagnicola]PPQ27125.1 hypothetical protein CCR94_20845 [Rhodoblastus sphagnicola]